MGRVSVIDCTLRDGGYVNDWYFGEAAIQGILALLGQSGVDVIEIGFLREEPYNKDRAVYSDLSQLAELIGDKVPGKLYSAMIDAGSRYRISQIPPYDGKCLDMLRLITWQRTFRQCCRDCRELQEKGYRVCIQPTRVDQYTADELKDLIKLANEVQPYGFYLVDSFGLLRKKELLAYVEVADQFLSPSIRLGYHAHNNMQQAFLNAAAFLEAGLERDILVDASILGMGRGAGNLFLEPLLEHLNKGYQKQYNLDPVLQAAQSYVEPIKEQHAWGYSPHYFVSALHHCNPDFAAYYMSKYNMPVLRLQALLKCLPEPFLFTAQRADEHYTAFLKQESPL